MAPDPPGATQLPPPTAASESQPPILLLFDALESGAWHRGQAVKEFQKRARIGASVSQSLRHRAEIMRQARWRGQAPQGVRA